MSCPNFFGGGGGIHGQGRDKHMNIVKSHFSRCFADADYALLSVNFDLKWKGGFNCLVEAFLFQDCFWIQEENRPRKRESTQSVVVRRKQQLLAPSCSFPQPPADLSCPKTPFFFQNLNSHRLCIPTSEGPKKPQLHAMFLENYHRREKWTQTSSTCPAGKTRTGK